MKGVRKEKGKLVEGFDTNLDTYIYVYVCKQGRRANLIIMVEGKCFRGVH